MYCKKANILCLSFRGLAKVFFSVFLTLGLVFNLQAQSDRTISGSVKDAQGAPVIGATIVLKGTSVGTTSDVNGSFQLNILAKNLTAGRNVLNISYIGMKSLDMPLGVNNVINVVLENETIGVDEVVVTALGIKKETKALTYNVQEFKPAELVTVKDANFMNALAGKVAGVAINTSSAGVGGSVRVVMRGTKSISGNNNALYVVDGIPLPQLSTDQPKDMYTGMGQSGDGIASLNPEDIESLSVLTGAAAAALYGSDAANGVVLVTTKKGQSGKVSVSVSNSTTFSSPFVLPEFQNTYGSNVGEYASWGAKLYKPTSYNPADFFQTGYNVNNSVNLSMGSEVNQSYFSAATVNAQGIIDNNDLDRYNVTFRNSSSLLDNKLNIDFSTMFMQTNEQNMLSQGQYFNPLVPIYLFPRGDDIAKYQVFERYDVTRNFKIQYWPYGDQGMMMQNPYWITERGIFENKKSRYLISGGLKYDLTDWLNVSGRVKYDGSNEIRTKKYYASTAELFARGPAGGYVKNDVQNTQIYADVMLGINKYIGDFAVTANVGASIRDNQYDFSGVDGALQSVPNLFTYSNLNQSSLRLLQNGYHDQTQAVFATGQLGYKSMIYLDVTGRIDWSTALAGTDSPYAAYPSVGLSGIFTELLPIKSHTLSFLKGRFSYSEVGNAPLRYTTKGTYPVQGGYPQTTTFLTDSNIKPERTQSYELGLTGKLFGNKVDFDVTLYKSSTYNQLFQPTMSASSGYSSYYVNAGRVDNKGIELSVGLNQALGSVFWNSVLVYSANRNTIKQLLPKTRTIFGEVSMDEMNMGGTDGYRMILKEGGSMGDIYVNTLKVDEHGYIVVDIISQKVTADPNNFIKAGNANPSGILGWRNNFEWNGFNLGFLINARLGGVCVSATQAKMDAYGVSKASADARDNGGALVNGERIPAKDYYQTIGGGDSGIGSMYVYDATNVRLAELSLGYDIQVKRFVNSISLSLVGRNLFMFYNKAPFDPESTASTGTYFQGVDYFMQPSLRNIGFSVKLNF